MSVHFHTYVIPKHLSKKKKKYAGCAGGNKPVLLNTSVVLLSIK